MLPAIDDADEEDCGTDDAPPAATMVWRCEGGDGVDVATVMPCMARRASAWFIRS